MSYPGEFVNKCFQQIWKSVRIFRKRRGAASGQGEIHKSGRVRTGKYYYICYLRNGGQHFYNSRNMAKGACGMKTNSMCEGFFFRPFPLALFSR